ncbi:MAG: hypothetical protein KDC38_19860 [Planctomycetes bacterium]|nr:hypothetical protein [Planctomycetota bacterium]
MSSPAATSDRWLPLVLTLAAVSLVVGIALAVLGEGFQPSGSTGVDSFSTRALGHHAFVELLVSAGIDAQRSRAESSLKARDESSLLVLAEPSDDERTTDELLEAFHTSRRTLLVLPKRAPVVRDGELVSTRLRETDEIDRLLRELDIDATVTRPVENSRYRYHSRGESEEPVVSAVDIEIRDPQVLRFGEVDGLDPILNSDAGPVLVHWNGFWQDVWILSDPDLIANHGLHRGDHAWVVLDFVRRCVGDNGRVIVDEVVHGFPSRASFWRRLTEFPIALITLHVLLVVGLLTWSALGRFGRPERGSIGHEPGWRPLVTNMANLLVAGRRHGHAIRQYLDDCVRDVERRLHRPAHLDEAATERWIEGIERRKELTPTLEELRRDVERVSSTGHGVHSILGIARRVHDWKTEMLNAAR